MAEARKRLKRWRQYSWAERRIVLAAAGRLLMAYAAFRVRETETLLDELTTRVPASSNAGAAAFDPHRAVWAIGIAARYVPWRSDCMVQAIATSRWLRARGYDPAFHLGLRQVETTGAMEAHAWLSLDGQVIVGGQVDGLERFARFH